MSIHTVGLERRIRDICYGHMSQVAADIVAEDIVAELYFIDFDSAERMHLAACPLQRIRRQDKATADQKQAAARARRHGGAA